jgi:hypothetical protein
MARRRKTYERFRDAKTGRFARRDKATKSLSRGFHRYKQERAKIYVRSERTAHARVPSIGSVPVRGSGAGGGEAGITSTASGQPIPGDSIGSLQDFYDFQDYDYDVIEFDTGIDYGEAT